LSLFSALREARTRTFFVPEVLQTSLMDCGPATLKSVFDGFGRPINLERLRERCQTDVDGTSLTAMHETAERLGLEVEQIMVPKDNLLEPTAACLPAIVFLANPDGLLHFVTVWNVVGSRVQLMDPARGRVWMDKGALLSQVATPLLELPEARWRKWAGGDDFARPFRAKLRALGLSGREADRLLASAREDPSPRSLAALDAATRMVRNLVDGGAVPRGRAARAVLERAFETDRTGDPPKIPEPYWICLPSKKPGNVLARGVVMLHIEGVRDEAADEMPAPAAAEDVGPRGTQPLAGAPFREARSITVSRGASRGARTSMRETRLAANDVLPDARPSIAARASRIVTGESAHRQSIWAGPVVPPEVMRELRAPSVRPHRIFLRMLWEDSRAAVLLLGAIVIIGTATGVLDALLMRGLSDLLGRMNLVAHRLFAIVAVVLFLALALFFEIAEARIVQRLARGLEARLRVTFLEKLPKLEDRYFRSRPVSDMASRAHLLQTLRGIPRFGVELGSGILQLVTTTGVIIWLEPRLWKLAIALLIVCATVPLLTFRLIEEAMARMRIQGGALFRFYLDALLGVVPIRVHGAERAVRREHEAILTEWARSGTSVESRMLAIQTFERIFGTAVAAIIVVTYVRSGGDLRALLLLAFFAQRLPAQAEALVASARRYPLLKHDALRLFEPLAAAETQVHAVPPRPKRTASGIDIAFQNVTAVAGGREILSAVNLGVRRGTHVAIVGASGAGKSSLVSVLLGWLGVTDGRVLVDGRPLDAQRLVQLRDETAWVDPAVQLWNATLLDNLLYGHGDAGLAGLEDALASADLLDVVERMPDGLQSTLGEGGARVSGGQGQRVRAGRALLKRDARLVILDEPFRGLEREKRRRLLARAREIWRHATILFVSHDVGDTLEMDRVIVVHEGRIAEDGTPAELLAQTDGHFAKLVEGDRRASDDVWGRSGWRRTVLDEGVLAPRKATGEG
jgi:ABC-type bacteriocin/lantibiotic exporter with double-glycine peptidase domain